MVNLLILPSANRRFLKRGILILCTLVLGTVLVDSQAADPFATNQTQFQTSPPSTTAVVTPAPRVPEGKLVLVPPGTIVEKAAPSGWSHLILKSLPRINPQHRGLVSASAFQLSSLVFTSILAKVEAVPQSNPPRYVLGDIGLGLGTKVRGQDMVLSPETQAQLGANLGFQERIVLSECYKRQAMARSVTRTATMAVFDTHAVMIREGQHRLCKVRYAVLLDPRSGRIATLSWGVDLDPQGRPYSANSAIEWLPLNKIDDLVLHVDPRQITLGIPGDLAFAVNQVPQGHSEIPLTRNLALLSGKPAYTPQDAGELESALRLEIQRLLQKTARQESANPIAVSSSQR